MQVGADPRAPTDQQFHCNQITTTLPQPKIAGCNMDDAPRNNTCDEMQTMIRILFEFHQQFAFVRQIREFQH